MTIFGLLFKKKPDTSPAKVRRVATPGRAAASRARGEPAPKGGAALQLAKGLKRKDAYRAASARMKGRDFRGFSYDPKTGKAVCT